MTDYQVVLQDEDGDRTRETITGGARVERTDTGWRLLDDQGNELRHLPTWSVRRCSPALIASPD